MSNGTATSDGILFEPINAGSHYISLFYHRTGSRSDKSLWHASFSPTAEFSLFAEAEIKRWSDTKSQLWAVHAQGATVLGQRGERLARFPHPQNATDPWHGFPVSPQDRESDTPPDDFIDLWIEKNVVSRVFGRRMQRRKI